MSGPGATQNHIMFSIEEIRYHKLAAYPFRKAVQLTCVSGVYFHGVEAIVRRQWRAGPLPDTPQLTMTGKSIAVLDDWGRMPVFEPDVAVGKVKEHWQGALRWWLYRLVIRGPRTARIGLGISVPVRVSVTALSSVLEQIWRYAFSLTHGH